MKTDWNNPLLRAAAVDYTLTRAAKPPAREDDPQWLASVKACALACGLTGADVGADWRDLARWCRDKALRPESAERYAGGKLNGVANADREIIKSGCADALREMTDDAEDVLSDAAREDLAARLESGGTLTNHQRQALATALRGASMARRSETVRAVLDFVSDLSGQAPQSIRWETHETRRAVMKGEAVLTIPLTVHVPGFPVAGRYAIAIGDRVWIPFARQSGPIRDGHVRIRMLRPANTLDWPLIARRFTLLRSLVCPNGSGQGQWADIFGQTKQAVSLAMRRIAEEIQQRTESAGGYRQLRNTPQRNKGRGPRR